MRAEFTLSLPVPCTGLVLHGALRGHHCSDPSAELLGGLCDMILLFQLLIASCEVFIKRIIIMITTASISDPV